MVSRIYHEGPEDFLWFWCPGCGTNHRVPVTGTRKWEWNGSVDKPTLKPSIKVTMSEQICHSFVTEGQIQFLGDCTHDLAGQTINLEEEDEI